MRVCPSVCLATDFAYVDFLSLDLEIEGSKYKEVGYRSKSILSVTCKISEDPKLVRLSWMKGNKNVKSEGEGDGDGTNVYVRDKGNRSELIFDGPDGADTGEYRCRGDVSSRYVARIESRSVYVQVTSKSCTSMCILHAQA